MPTACQYNLASKHYHSLIVLQHHHDVVRNLSQFAHAIAAKGRKEEDEITGKAPFGGNGARPRRDSACAAKSRALALKKPPEGGFSKI